MTPDEEFRLARVHKSLIRPQLMFGCDRALVFGLLMATTLLMGPGGIGSGNTVNFFWGLFTLVIGIRLLAALAKFDPDAREIFRRSLRFVEVYGGSSGFRAKTKKYK